MVIMCIIIVVALVLIGLIVYTQKHLSDKRNRLDDSLVHNDASAVLCVWFYGV